MSRGNPLSQSEPVLEQPIPNPLKAFMVQRFACYQNVEEVQAAVKQEFGLNLDFDTVSVYNPLLAAGESRLGQQWINLFIKTRESFHALIDDVGIAQKVYRLQKLDEMERAARRQKEYKLAGEMLKLAKEEMEEKGKGISLEALQAEMDKMATAIVRHVKDPEVIRAIEADWGNPVGEESLAARLKANFGV